MSINPDIDVEVPGSDAPLGEKPLVLYEVSEALGRLTFVPLIAIPALLGLTPLGSTVVFAILAGLLVAAVGVQLLMGYEFVQIPGKFAYTRITNRIAQYFSVHLLEFKSWLDEGSAPRMAWLTARPISALSYVALVGVGIALPFMTAAGQPTSLMFIALLVYSTGHITRDGRYVLASAIVLSLASTVPMLLLAS